MEIGIFAKTFNRPTVEGVFDAVAGEGLHVVQFNMTCAGLPSMPDAIDPAVVERIRQAADQRTIGIAAVSGTFNMIHPNVQVREEGLRRLAVLAAACKGLGTGMITLCTGTRDPDDMWRAHPDNQSAEAWQDMTAMMAKALAIAEAHDITLGIETEVANVVDTAQRARLLLDAMQSPRLKIIMDGANLFHKGALARMRQVLDDAFDLLGRDIALAHAKDLSEDGKAGHEAAGTGLLDYDHYLKLLRDVGSDGALVLHGLSEQQVATSVAFLRGKM